MEIKTTYGGLELIIEPEISENEESVYRVYFGSQSVIVSKLNWVEISKIILNAMEFIDDNL